MSSSTKNHTGKENVTFKMGSFFPVSSVIVENIHSNKSGFMDIANKSKADEEMTSNDTVLVSNETETDIFANETTPHYVLISQPLLTLNETKSGLEGTSVLIPSNTNLTVEKEESFPRNANRSKLQNHEKVIWERVSSSSVRRESSPHFENVTSQNESIVYFQVHSRSAKRPVMSYTETLREFRTPTTLRVLSSRSVASNVSATFPSKSGIRVKDSWQSTAVASTLEHRVESFKSVLSSSLPRGLTYTFEPSPSVTLESGSPIMSEKGTSLIKRIKQTPALNFPRGKHVLITSPLITERVTTREDPEGLLQRRGKVWLTANTIWKPSHATRVFSGLKIHSVRNTTSSLSVLYGQDLSRAELSEMHLWSTAMLRETSSVFRGYSPWRSPNSSSLKHFSKLKIAREAMLQTLTPSLPRSKQDSSVSFKEAAFSRIDSPSGIQQTLAATAVPNSNAHVHEEHFSMSAIVNKANGSVRMSNIFTNENSPFPNRLIAPRIQTESSSESIERDRIPVVTPRLQVLPGLSDVASKEFHSQSSSPDSYTQSVEKSTVIESFDQNTQFAVANPSTLPADLEMTNSPSATLTISFMSLKIQQKKSKIKSSSLDSTILSNVTADLGLSSISPSYSREVEELNSQLSSSTALPNAVSTPPEKPLKRSNLVFPESQKTNPFHKMDNVTVTDAVESKDQADLSTPPSPLTSRNRSSITALPITVSPRVSLSYFVPSLPSTMSSFSQHKSFMERNTALDVSTSFSVRRSGYTLHHSPFLPLAYIVKLPSTPSLDDWRTPSTDESKTVLGKLDLDTQVSSLQISHGHYTRTPSLVSESSQLRSLVTSNNTTRRTLEKKDFITSVRNAAKVEPKQPRRRDSWSSMNFQNASQKTASTIKVTKNENNSSSSAISGGKKFQELGSGTLAVASVNVSSPLERTLNETRKGKEKIVSSLESGIIFSPLFNLASQHIEEVLKNQTGLLLSVSRLENMLGDLQKNVLRATKLHLEKPFNLSLADHESNTSEIAKHVDFRLNHISSRLKHISSVLKALQQKGYQQNATVVETSKVAASQNGTKPDDKRNELIERLLKRFSKLEALIKTQKGSAMDRNSTATINSSRREDINANVLNVSSLGSLDFLNEKKTHSTFPRVVSSASYALTRTESVVVHSHYTSFTTSTITNKTLLQTSLASSLTTSTLKASPRINDSSGHPHSSVVTHSVHPDIWKNKAQVQKSKVFTYVTFRGGLEAGVFTNRGKVDSMETCVELCYNHILCHVAFVVGNTCYSIQCYSQKTCEVLPIHTTVINTRVVYLKDRMLRLPYSVISHPTASSLVKNNNFTIKNCAKNTTVLRNMTFLAGMSAGNYTDYGTVNSIEACSNICCSKRVCDAAFMILNNCFTIDCVSDKACHAIPSKSNKVNTAIVFFRKTLSDKLVHPLHIEIPKRRKPLSCHLVSGVLKGVVFRGGMNAGNFTDQGLVGGFSSCVGKCCHLPDCDAAFMVEKNCYSVKCSKNKRLCDPVVARSTKFKTFVALKKGVYLDNLTLSDSKHDNCVQQGSIQHGFTFQKGMKAGNFTSRGEVKNMSTCIQRCCANTCQAAFMIGNTCYSVVCHSKKDCRTVKAKRMDFTTAIAFVNQASKNITGDKGSNRMNKFTKSILGGQCEITDEQANVTITGGWRAGKFLRLPDVKGMGKCIEACCEYNGCGAAMFIGQFCYNLICFQSSGCQLTGTKQDFMISRFVAVHKIEGHVPPPHKKAQIGRLTRSKEHLDIRRFMEDLKSAFKVGNHSSRSTIGTGNEINVKTIPPYSIPRTSFLTNSFVPVFKNSEISSLKSSKSKSQISWFSLSKTAFSAGASVASLIGSFRTESNTITSTNFTKHLDRSVAGSNVGSAISTTPILPPLPKRSTSMEPFVSGVMEDGGAEAPPSSYKNLLRPSINQESSISFSSPSGIDSQNDTSASPLPSEEYSFLSDYSLLKERKNRNRKRSYACTHTFVFNNSTLRGGLHAGDVKNEGKVDGMEECVEMCCKTAECNVALLINEVCYIVACSNKKNCEAIPEKGSGNRENPKVAYVARSKTETQFIKKLISHAETLKEKHLSENGTVKNKTSHELPLVKQGSCIRSPILRDVRFKLGMHAGDFKSMGRVTGVDECVVLCCKSNACNAIFMLRSRCHLVSCSSEFDCQTVAAESEFYQPTVVYVARNRLEADYFLKMIPKKMLDKFQANSRTDAMSYKDEPAIRRSELGRTKHEKDTEFNVANSSSLSQASHFGLSSSETMNVTVSATSSMMSSNASRSEKEVLPTVNSHKVFPSKSSSYVVSGFFNPKPSQAEISHEDTSNAKKPSVSFNYLEQTSVTTRFSNDESTLNAVMSSPTIFKGLEPVLASPTVKKTWSPTLASSKFWSPFHGDVTKSLRLSSSLRMTILTWPISSFSSEPKARKHDTLPLSALASTEVQENFPESTAIKAKLERKDGTPVKSSSLRNLIGLVETPNTVKSLQFSAKVDSQKSVAVSPSWLLNNPSTSGGGTSTGITSSTSSGLHKIAISTEIQSSDSFSYSLAASVSVLVREQSEGNAFSTIKDSRNEKRRSSTLTLKSEHGPPFTVPKIKSTSPRILRMPHPRTTNIEGVSNSRVSSGENVQTTFKMSDVGFSKTPVKALGEKTSRRNTRIQENRRNFIPLLKLSTTLGSSWTTSIASMDSYPRRTNLLTTKARNAAFSSHLRNLPSTNVFSSNATTISSSDFTIAALSKARGGNEDSQRREAATAIAIVRSPTTGSSPSVASANSNDTSSSLNRPLQTSFDVLMTSAGLASSSNTNSPLNRAVNTSLSYEPLTSDNTPKHEKSSRKILHSSNNKIQTEVRQNALRRRYQRSHIRSAFFVVQEITATSTAEFLGPVTDHVLHNLPSAPSSSLSARKSPLVSLTLFPSPSSLRGTNVLTVTPSLIVLQTKTEATGRELDDNNAPTATPSRVTVQPKKTKAAEIVVPERRQLNKTKSISFQQNEIASIQNTPSLGTHFVRKLVSLDTNGITSSYVRKASILSSSKTAVHLTPSLKTFPTAIAYKGQTMSQMNLFAKKERLRTHTSSSNKKQKRVEIPKVNAFGGGVLEQIGPFESTNPLRPHSSTGSTKDGASLSREVLERTRPLPVTPPFLSSSESFVPFKSSDTGRKRISSVKGKLVLPASISDLQRAQLFIEHIKSVTQTTPQLEGKPSNTIWRTVHGKAQNRENLSNDQQTSLSFLISPSPAFSLTSGIVSIPSSQQQAHFVRVNHKTASHGIRPSIGTQENTSLLSLLSTPAPLLPTKTVYSKIERRSKSRQHPESRDFNTSLPRSNEHNEERDILRYFGHLFQSIKDILTKKNSHIAKVLTNSVEHVSKNTGVISEITTPLSVTPTLNFGTDSRYSLVSFTGVSSTIAVHVASDTALRVKKSITTSRLKSAPPTQTKSSQPGTPIGLDISEAMRPLHWRSPLCEHSAVHFNSTFRGGINAGVLTEVGVVTSDNECISQCCLNKTCDAVFLILNRCFLVACKSKRLCQRVPAKTLTFSPRVIYREVKVTTQIRGNRKTTKNSFTEISKMKDTYSGGQTTFGLLQGYAGNKRANIEKEKDENTKACIPSITLQNVTLRNGINSGYFRDEGTVKSMQECIELCCKRINCSVAFMLVNRCFSVSCYNKFSCKSIPARTSIFQPQLAYVGRDLGSLFSAPISLTDTISITATRTDFLASSTYSTYTGTKRNIIRFHDDCRYGNTEKKVTLRGGVNAGSFIDTGVVANIEQCVNHCCQATKCDVAFMIMKRCFLVTCSSFQLCESVPVRNGDYFTELVHLSRDDSDIAEDFLAKLVRPSSMSVKTRNDLVTRTAHRSSWLSSLNWPTSASQRTLIEGKHLSLRSPIIGSHMQFRSPIAPPAVPAQRVLIKSTIQPIRVNGSEDIRLIQTLGMSTLRISLRHSPKKTITPSTIVVKSPFSNLGRPERGRNVTSLEKQLGTGKAEVEDETCQSTIVYYNATLRGGIKAGIFKDQGSVQNMRKCIERCCRWQFCGVAFMLLTRCYTIACYNEHLCAPVAARNLTFTPRIAFVSRMRRDQGNLTDMSGNFTTFWPIRSFALDNTTLGGKNSSLSQATESFSPSTASKIAFSLPSPIQIRPSPSHSLISKVVTQRWDSHNNCTSSNPRYNVTLRGGLNAGNFTDNGKFENIEQCVDFCCKESHCDLALMLLDHCFTVRCHNRHLCESVSSKTAKYRSRIVYVEKISGVNSSSAFHRNSSQTISLLDAALPAMGGGHQRKPIRTDGLYTRNGIGAFHSELLAQILKPSPSTVKNNAVLKSSIFELKNWSPYDLSAKHSKVVGIQQVLNQTIFTPTSQHQPRVMPSSFSLSSNESLLRVASTIASIKTEQNKSASEEEVTSGATSGRAKTLGDPSGYEISHPSSCLNSPISYNVTLRNGIRSGYFRDQGRVENMAECIGKCCDFDACDVAFMLKQRCYLVTCYTETGCETVQARQSLFRPRVAHVQRTNQSQLLTFMDGQVKQSRSLFKVNHLTKSSTLPEAVKTLNHTNRPIKKTKELLLSKYDNSKSHETKEFHKRKRKGVGRNSGHLAKHKKAKHVTIVSHHVISGRKHVTDVGKHVTRFVQVRKKKEGHHVKIRHGKARRMELKHSRPLTSNISAVENFRTKLETKKGSRLSHGDLEKLFRFMKVHSSSGTKYSASSTATNQNNQSTFSGDRKLKSARTGKSHKPSKSEKRFENEERHRFDWSAKKSVKKAAPGNAKDRVTFATTTRVRVTEMPRVQQGKKSTVPLLPTEPPHTSDSSCNTGKIEFNQTLRGGLSSGLFHEVGQVNHIGACSQHCCSSPICDLAFMVLKHCFLVTCSSSNPRMCDSTPALATNFNPMISRVTRNDNGDLNHETVTVSNITSSPAGKPAALPTKMSLQQSEMLPPMSHSKNTTLTQSEIRPNLPEVAFRNTNEPTISKESGLLHQTRIPVAGCISSVTEHNVTLRGGLHAGRFTDAGVVNASSVCTKLCCEESSCDVAFHAFNRCFLVHCFDEYLCSFTPSLLPSFNPTVIHVYRHHTKPTPRPGTTLPPVNAVLEEIEAKSSKGENKSCAHSDVYEEVTLRMGYNAGNFTSRGKVNSTDECVMACCEQRGCDLIFMFLNNCYTISCSSSFACEIVPARKSRFKPRIVYLLKNNSRSVIKPSDFNSSLYDTNSTGERPVKAVHYKELPLQLQQKSRNSHDKDISKMSNITQRKEKLSNVTQRKEELSNVTQRKPELSSVTQRKPELSNVTQTVEEEFVVYPSAKMPLRSVKKLVGNGSLSVSKTNTGSHSFDNHGMKNRTESREDEEIDNLAKKLRNVSEENRRLESEIQFLMSKERQMKQSKIKPSTDLIHGHLKKTKPRPRTGAKKPKTTSRAGNERKSRSRQKDVGSLLDSKATKRVVLVDTDRPPVFPPTDEHTIEEHNIQRFAGKVRKKEHHVESSRKILLKGQHNEEFERGHGQNKALDWSPTNRTSGHESGSPKKLISHFDGYMGEGLNSRDEKSDTDDADNEEIVSLTPDIISRRRPKKPVLDGLESKFSDDKEKPEMRENVDELQFDIEMNPEMTKERGLDGLGSKTRDNLSSRKKKKPKNENYFQIERLHESNDFKAKAELYSPNGNSDLIKSLDHQMDQAYPSNGSLRDNRKEEIEDKDRLIVNSAKGRNEPVTREKEGFHQQLLPTNRSRFRMDRPTKSKNTDKDGFNLDNQRKLEKEEDGLINSKYAANQEIEVQDKQRDSSPGIYLDLDSRHEKKEEDNGNAGEVEVKNVHEEILEGKSQTSSGKKIKGQAQSLNKQQAHSHQIHFDVSSNRESMEGHRIEFHLDDMKDRLVEGSNAKTGKSEDNSKTIHRTTKSASKKPAPRFSTSDSQSMESHSVDQDESGRMPQSDEKALKTYHLLDNKRLSNDHENASDPTGNQQLAVEKAFEKISPTSANKHERPISIGRVQTRHHRRKHDLEAIFDKINVVYSHLQELMERYDHQHNETNEKFSRRHEEDIPTPSMSAQNSSIKMSSVGNPTETKTSVVKEYVTDKNEGSGALSIRHEDQLMDYIRNIYSRVQAIFDRSIKESALESEHTGVKARSNSSSRNQRVERKPFRDRTRSSIAKNAHQKITEKDETILKEMKDIYKKMKQMYWQEKRARKKDGVKRRKQQRQRQRSFIPTRSTKSVTRLRDLGRILDRVRPLNSTTGRNQNKAPRHRTCKYLLFVLW